jgi:hypothetical protein
LLPATSLNITVYNFNGGDLQYQTEQTTERVKCTVSLQEHNIKMDLREIRCEGVDRIGSNRLL